MLLAKVCRTGLSPVVINLLKTPVVPKQLNIVTHKQVSRLFTNEGRGAFTRSTRNKTVLEQAKAPAGETAFKVGQGALAGAAVVGLGTLCYYGLGLSDSTGIIDSSALWPQYVKDRIKATYMYVGGSVMATGASVAMCLRSPTVMRLVMRQGWVSLAVTIAAMLGSGMLVHSIPYKEGFGTKQIAWLIHTGIIGAVIAPMTLLGGPLVLKAACYTAGIVGGLSTIAICAPSEKFLQMGGIVAAGLGAVFVSSVGTFFFPPHTALGAGIYSFALYGGLIVFSLSLLYETQRVVKHAEIHPYYVGSHTMPYDPINNSMGIYMNAINIFIRILTILGTGGNRRK